jgi:hypothetical protein
MGLKIPCTSALRISQRAGVSPRSQWILFYWNSARVQAFGKGFGLLWEGRCSLFEPSWFLFGIPDFFTMALQCAGLLTVL